MCFEDDGGFNMNDLQHTEGGHKKTDAADTLRSGRPWHEPQEGLVWLRVDMGLKLICGGVGAEKKGGR